MLLLLLFGWWPAWRTGWVVSVVMFLRLALLRCLIVLLMCRLTCDLWRTRGLLLLVWLRHTFLWLWCALLLWCRLLLQLSLLCRIAAFVCLRCRG